MKKIRNLIIVVFSLGLLVLLIVFIAKKPTNSENDLLIGVLKHESSLPIYIADELGFFEKRDINVGLIELPPGDHMPSLIADRVDILSPTSFPVLFGVMSENPGLLYSVFPGAEIMDGPVLYGIITKKEFNGNSIYDLKGKSIMAINPFTKINIQTILYSAGIEKEKWPKINIASRDLALNSVLNGVADAAILDQPSLAVALSSDNFKLLEKNPRAKYIGSPYWSGAGAVKKDIWESHSEEFEKLMLAIDDAIIYINENSIEAHKVLATKLGLKEEISLQMGGYYFPLSIDSISYNDIGKTVSILIEAGLLENKIDMEGFFPPQNYLKK